MSRRSLAILSEGMLSDSQRRSLTLLSLGWIELTYVPEEPVRRRRRRGGSSSDTSPSRERSNRLRREDEEIFAIIRTFIAWEH